jgi:hypothetical protein
MDATAFDELDVPAPARAVGTTHFFAEEVDGRTVLSLDPAATRSDAFLASVRGSPAGGAYASAGDLARFVAALRSGALAPATLDELAAGRVDAGDALDEKLPEAPPVGPAVLQELDATEGGVVGVGYADRPERGYARAFGRAAIGMLLLGQVPRTSSVCARRRWSTRTRRSTGAPCALGRVLPGHMRRSYHGFGSHDFRLTTERSCSRGSYGPLPQALGADRQALPPPPGGGAAGGGRAGRARPRGVDARRRSAHAARHGPGRVGRARHGVTGAGDRTRTACRCSSVSPAPATTWRAGACTVR